MNHWESLKPAVEKYVLICLAGLVWIGVGLMLNYLAFNWLEAYKGHYVSLFVISGIVIAIVKTKFIFSGIVRKNINRILSFDEKGFILAFISWKSYLLIVIMMGLGIILRHSTFPKEYLSILYIGIGLALILSGSLYFLAFANESPR